MYAALVANHFFDEQSEIFDADVYAGSDVDDLRTIVSVHQKHTCVSKVVDMKEFATRRAASPNLYASSAVCFCHEELADQRGQHMRIVEVVIIVWSVQISRHQADEIASEL